jgi:hypothetical protein
LFENEQRSHQANGLCRATFVGVEVEQGRFQFDPPNWLMPAQKDGDGGSAYLPSEEETGLDGSSRAEMVS